MVKIITIHQEMEWTNYVLKSKKYDFYHTWYYHSLEQSGEHILFVYEENEDYIAFPLLKREIPDSSFYDLSCVYGYTGPISNKSFSDLKEEMKQNFKVKFLKFLDEEKYITVFSRLHPFLDQLSLMGKFEGICENGKTVVIDLRESIEVQRSKYQKRVLEKINQLRRKGYYIKEVAEETKIHEFIGIYAENMKRVGAKDFYMFNEDYFMKLLNSCEFSSKLILVYKGDEAVCGAIIVCTQDIIQAHLLATKTEYLKDSPAKLLTDEISVLGRKLGMKYFNLGGGVGFKEDSLFSWKAAFSNVFYTFNSWRYIADSKKYDSLLKKSKVDTSANIDFFPLYRYSYALSLVCDICHGF